MAKNTVIVNFTAAAKKLLEELLKRTTNELSKKGVSAKNGNDKQFKAELKSMQSIVLFLKEEGPLFKVDIGKTLDAATLANVRKKGVLEKDRNSFNEYVLGLIASYSENVKNSSNIPGPVEVITIETIQKICLNFLRNGLVSDSALKDFEACFAHQAVAN